ncbi:sensor histidine kinase [Kordia sp.]|uniref:sensor histidine kinase n=1 Tax=Kordia sp. TaxID=1965332 RepID=UPI003D6A4FB7
MKLPLVTSFFVFFGFLLLISSCESRKIQKNPIPAKIFENEELAKSLRNKGKFDSAIYHQEIALKEAIKLKDTASIKESYHGLYLSYKKKKNIDSAFSYLQKIYNIVSLMNDTVWMAKIYHKKGALYKDIDSTKLSLSNFTDSKNLYLKIGNTIGAGKELLEVANVQRGLGSFGACELTATEGLKYLEGTNELKSIGGLYLALATISRETERTKVANDYIDKALELVKDSSAVKEIDKITIGKFKNTKANILKDLEKFDEAIYYLESALKDFKNNTLEAKRTQFNLAHTIYVKNGYNTVSDSLLRNSYEYFLSQNKDSEIFSTLLKRAQLYKDVDKGKSTQYINEALKSAEDRDKKKSIYEALEIKLDIDFNKIDYKRFIALRNELQREKEDLDYFYINYRFNYEDAEKEKIRAENETIIAESKASKRTTQLLILFLILISLIVLIFFIYQRIKRRHKIEKLKTVHVTEARISSKVHDELANDLYELMSQLETSSPEKEMILDKLDTIYNQARDISKQIQSVDTDQKFADELSNLFRSYQSEKINVLLKRYDVEIWKGISSHIKITVYRVLQELLTNMKKHSNAALVVVSIEKNNKQLFIQYIDNGKGFTEEISKNGLQNAENRIHAIKGKLTFDTELHKGCKFSINVPV